MSFNAAKARTKYALPLWVDAFVRDTMDLSADEIGAFNLILWAMWSRESCDLPDDDRKLARVARSTPQTWKRRVRPSLEPFFEIENGVWRSVRLSREATKTEKFLKSQSDRRSGGDQKNEAFTRHGGAQSENTETGINSDNHLKLNNQVSTGDASADQSPEHPTQETKYISGGGSSAGARDPDPPGLDDAIDPPPNPQPPSNRERLLKAIGADPISGMIGPNGKQIGRLADMQEFNRWRDDLGLTTDEVVDVIGDVMAGKTDGPPSAFSYFTQPMQRFAAGKSKPALTPIEGGRHDRPDQEPRKAANAGRGGTHGKFLAAFVGQIPDDA